MKKLVHSIIITLSLLGSSTYLSAMEIKSGSGPNEVFEETTSSQTPSISQNLSLGAAKLAQLAALIKIRVGGFMADDTLHQDVHALYGDKDHMSIDIICDQIIEDTFDKIPELATMLKKHPKEFRTVQIIVKTQVKGLLEAADSLDADTKATITHLFDTALKKYSAHIKTQGYCSSSSLEPKNSHRSESSYDYDDGPGITGFDVAAAAVVYPTFGYIAYLVYQKACEAYFGTQQ